MSSPSIRYPAAEGPGSVSQAPQPPAGFTDTFTSRYIDTGDLRQHVVTGGGGPAAAAGARLAADLVRPTPPRRRSPGRPGRARETGRRAFGSCRLPVLR